MLVANGIPLPIDVADAEDVAEMLVATRRAVPYELWASDPDDRVRAELDRIF
jgi:hypothetical protein